MGSDIARVTFDPTRQYRSVVLQQGRVTLEADGNEASRIASEALRLETIDLIGPAATPDDGYKLGLDASGKVVVLPGTMYLGGWRLKLDAPVELDNQPDWLDMPPLQGFGGPTLVALLATEQEVCAVEDQPLREVALGGPDSAARTRLMQHFLRLPLRGSTCDDAAKEIDTLLAADGVTLDPKTFQLLSSARLQVGFVPPVGRARSVRSARARRLSRRRQSADPRHRHRPSIRRRAPARCCGAGTTPRSSIAARRRDRTR